LKIGFPLFLKNKTNFLLKKTQGNFVNIEKLIVSQKIGKTD